MGNEDPHGRSFYLFPRPLLGRAVNKSLDAIGNNDLEATYQAAIANWQRNLPIGSRVTADIFLEALRNLPKDLNARSDPSRQTDLEDLCSEEAWLQRLLQLCESVRSRTGPSCHDFFLLPAPTLRGLLQPLAEDLAHASKTNEDVFRELIYLRTRPESAEEKNPRRFNEIKRVFALNGYKTTRTEYKADCRTFNAEKTSELYPPRFLVVEIATKDHMDRGLNQITKSRRPADTLIIVCDNDDRRAALQDRSFQGNTKVVSSSQLLETFEKFDDYLELVIGTGEAAQRLFQLNKIYQDVRFDDRHGSSSATKFLSTWKETPNPKRRWILVTGEYGTGKTALTQVLQYRWMQEYKENRSRPIPIRLQLRDFRTEFNADSLLSLFIRRNGLEGMPVGYLRELIARNRVVLLLDGYDEMAQYMVPRERRACLLALAELGSDGARGIITGRPNYFTEAEELEMLEGLYRRIEGDPILAGTHRVAKERQLDQLLEQHIIERHDRKLSDLTTKQVRRLIELRIPGNREAQRALLSLLKQVSSPDQGGSLSGRPVIVSFLIELADRIRVSDGTPPGQGAEERLKTLGSGPLSEWKLFDYIIDELMLRDWDQRSQDIQPSERRSFLAHLAWDMTADGRHELKHDEFQQRVESEHRAVLDRIEPGDRRHEVEKRTANLRSSATLTADEDKKNWSFSHSALREFFVAERLASASTAADYMGPFVPVSDAMESLLASRGESEMEGMLQSLERLWFQARGGGVFSSCLDAVWNWSLTKHGLTKTLRRLSHGSLNCSGMEWRRFLFAAEEEEDCDLRKVDFSGCTFAECTFRSLDLRGAEFRGASLDTVVFEDCRLSDASFKGSTLVDVAFNRSDISSADCTDIPMDLCSIIQWRELEGQQAIGWLATQGAKTDQVVSFNYFIHFTSFDALTRVWERLSKQTTHQRRGIEMRGLSEDDSKDVRSFVKHALSADLLRRGRGADTLVVTDLGRDVFGTLDPCSNLPISLERFCADLYGLAHLFRPEP